MISFESCPLYLQIVIALFLDLLVGDPHWFPHPVRGIGKIIESGEYVLRNVCIPERIAGVVLSLFVVAFVYFMTRQFVLFAGGLGEIYKVAATIVIIYFTLSIRGLVKEARKIILMLRLDNIEGARNQLANIVGRDTANLSKDQIRRACIESVAENMVDGIMSPLFFAFIGGAPLAMAYKAINTLDSMVGYKNSKYIRFGWASARLDDVVNFVPARITFGLVPIASFLCAESPLKSIKTGLRDWHKHPSPNSGIPEALFAGALRVQLGGKCSYNSVSCDKPVIGDAEMPLSENKIEKAIHIVYVCSFLATIFGSVVLFVVS